MEASLWDIAVIEVDKDFCELQIEGKTLLRLPIAMREEAEKAMDTLDSFFMFWAHNQIEAISKHHQEESRHLHTELAWLINRNRANVTEACAGNFTICDCKSCVRRRRLQASGKLFTPYEIHALSDEGFERYLYSPPRKTEP